MKKNAYLTLVIELEKSNFSSFFPLLRKGFKAKAQIGGSIKNLLCEQFKVETNYLDERIKTIFLNGKPVDNVETAAVDDGSSVALSAAMPGLAGATFRRGGTLAAFRSGITYQAEGAFVDTSEMGMVNIKLFNMVVNELGPLFLEEGIWVKREDVEDCLKNRTDTPRSLIRYAEKDGQQITQEQLASLNWSGEAEYVFLRVSNLISKTNSSS